MKNMLQKLSTWLSDQNVDFTERIFVLLTIIADIGVLIMLIVNIARGESPVEIGILVATEITVPVTTFLCVRKKNVYLATRLIVIGLVFVILPTVFVFGGGVEGGGVFWFVFSYLYVGLVLTGGWRVFFLIALTALSLIGYLIDYFHPEWIVQHSRWMFYADSYASMVVVGFVCFVMVMFQNRMFHAENRRARAETKKAEELNRSQNRFFSSMSHEIRTPINSILGLNELILRQEDTSDEVARDARNIQGAGKMLLALINDILDFSKIEAGSMDIVPVEYRVGDMISEIVNMIWLRANEKGLKFNVDIDPQVPAVLFGDEVRIKQILVNLLNNAVKYTPSGSVGLHIESEAAGEKSVLLKISVSDTGMGIKQEALPYLFDAFKRVDQEKNRMIEGTGLGLSIVKQLVELMDGTITVNSVYTQGSTFTVNLRQTVVDEKVVGDISITNSEIGVVRQKHERLFSAPEARILIVDDNEMNLEVEKKLLDDTDVTVDTVSSGAQALEKTLLTGYDIILMDHLMPEMDGIECLERIRSQAGGLNKNIPIIVLTANAGGENRELYNNAGFDGYLVKPVSGRQLEDMLLKHLPAEKVFRTESSSMTGEEMNTGKGYSRKLPILITANSMSDLPDAVIRQLGIGIIPSNVRTADGVFKDGVDIGADELIRYINSNRGDARSAPPEVSDYTAFFGAALKRAHQVIHIALTTSMSVEVQRATEAAKSFENVTVVNSESISSATGLLVLIACRMVKQNRSAAEIVEELERVKKQIHCSFIINTTDYMARVGRVSKTVNAIARALELRPCLKIRDDRSGIGGAWLGKTRHCYDRYIQSALRASADPDTDLLFVTYADIPEEDLNWIAGRIRGRVAFNRIVFQQASAAISSNCGPGTFGLLFLDKGERGYNLDALIPEERASAETDEERPAPVETPAPAKANPAAAPEPQPQPEPEDPWLAGVNGIDHAEAMKNCGRIEILRSALELFYKKIGEDADTIESLWHGGDLQNYTIKVHALKSAARTIGALELSERAKAMEDAGKAGDTVSIDEKTPELLKLYRSYAEIFKPSFETGEEDARPPADEGMLAEAYAAISECAAMMDYDMTESVLASLDGYCLSPEDAKHVEDIRDAMMELDWERVAALCKQ
ncbi:MAG: DegV family EDD domain-containing protein [Ruminococcaceae bacterium]|nr:DegV family EDD domain-containing protein [Oscillospiraceae bacterium]